MENNANNKGYLPGLVGASNYTHIVYLFVDLSAVANLAKVKAASTGPGVVHHTSGIASNHPHVTPDRLQATTPTWI